MSSTHHESNPTLAKAQASSSSFVLRCYAPPFIASMWRRASTRIGDDRDVLSSRFALVEVLLRFHVAVLATEWAGLLGKQSDVQEASDQPIHQVPEDFSRLLNKIRGNPDKGNPSLGDWSKAASMLAKSLVRHKEQAVAPEFINLWYTSSRKSKATDAYKAFQSVVELRNKIFHPDSGDMIPGVIHVKPHLKELDELLKVIIPAHRFLMQYPLLYCDPIQRTQGRARKLTIHRITGEELEKIEFTNVAKHIIPQDKVMMMVGDQGSCLMLSPWIVWGPSTGQNGSTARLFCNAANHRLLYTDASASEASICDAIEDEADWMPPINLIQRSREHAREDDVFPNEYVKRLRNQLVNTPTQIDQYEIIGTLGTGACGIVYLAKYKLGGLRALKVLHQIIVGHRNQRTRLRREYESLHQIMHPNVVKVYAYGEDPVYGPFVVMDYVEGEDLDQVASYTSLSTRQVTSIGIELLSALAATHYHGIIHRDIKPSNILLDAEGHIHLIDFGVALADHLVRATQTLEAVGTLSFCAPEQIYGGEVDQRSDLYSVGKLLKHLIKGPPYLKSNEIPTGLNAILRKATQETPAHRYQNASEMMEDLKKQLESGFQGAPVQVGDCLEKNYELHTLVQNIGDDLWLFEGIEIASKDEVRIILAAHATAKESLQQSIQSLSSSQKQKIGYRSLQTTSDQLLFLVLAHHIPLELLAHTLSLEITVEHTSENSDAQQRHDQIDPAHYLQLLSAPTMTDVFSANHYLELLITLLSYLLNILNANIANIKSTIKSNNWMAIFNNVRQLLNHDLVQISPLQVISWYAQLNHLRERRNLLAHQNLSNRLDAILLTDEEKEILHQIYSLVLRISQHVSAESISPYVIPLGQNDWGVLQKHAGTLQYYSLKTQEYVNIPPQALAQLVSLGLVKDSSMKTLVDARHKTIQQDEQEVLQELQALSWCSTVKSMSNHLVVYDDDQKAMAMIEIKRDDIPLNDVLSTSQIESARTLQVQLFGTYWRSQWYWTFIGDSDSRHSESFPLKTSLQHLSVTYCHALLREQLRQDSVTQKGTLSPLYDSAGEKRITWSPFDSLQSIYGFIKTQIETSTSVIQVGLTRAQHYIHLKERFNEYASQVASQLNSDSYQVDLQLDKMLMQTQLEVTTDHPYEMFQIISPVLKTYINLLNLISNAETRTSEMSEVQKAILKQWASDLDGYLNDENRLPNDFLNTKRLASYDAAEHIIKALISKENLQGKYLKRTVNHQLFAFTTAIQPPANTIGIDKSMMSFIAVPKLWSTSSARDPDLEEWALKFATDKREARRGIYVILAHRLPIRKHAPGRYKDPTFKKGLKALIDQVTQQGFGQAHLLNLGYRSYVGVIVHVSSYHELQQAPEVHMKKSIENLVKLHHTQVII